MVLTVRSGIVGALVAALVVAGALGAHAQSSRRSVVANFYPVAYAARARRR